MYRHENKFDDLTTNAIVKSSIAELSKKVTVSREYDVPYLAGYSKDGKTVYLDRHLPTEFTARGKKIDVAKFVMLHEIVEKSLIDEVGLHYEHAHHLAILAEKNAVEAEGIPWMVYEKFVRKYIKNEGKDMEKVPPDLDLTPYVDSHDRAMIAKIKSLQ